MSLLLLIFLHHVGDVWGQPSWLIKNKKKHIFAIYEHSIVWTGVVAVGLLVLDLLAPWKILFLLIGHFLIDYVKYQKVPDKTNYNWIYPDQLLHYIQILIIYFIK
jgi:hypothetical protein